MTSKTTLERSALTRPSTLNKRINVATIEQLWPASEPTNNKFTLGQEKMALTKTDLLSRLATEHLVNVVTGSSEPCKTR